MLDRTLKLMHIQSPGLTNDSISVIQAAGAMAILWGKLSVNSPATLVLAAAPDKC